MEPRLTRTYAKWLRKHIDQFTKTCLTTTFRNHHHGL